MVNRMKDGIRKRGSTWYYTVHLGKRPAQRCTTCNRRYWIERRPRTACECGGELVEKAENRSRTAGGFKTQKEAKAARDSERVKVQDLVFADAGRLTVSEYLREWVDTLPRVEDNADDGLAPTTRTSYKMHCERHLLPRLGALRLKELTGKRLREHWAYLGREGKMDGTALSPATVRRVRAITHAALADAVEDDLLAYNPANTVGRRRRGNGKRDKAKLRVWTRDQLSTFLDSARDDRLHTLWAVIVGTGMRRGEALGLRWESVDLDDAMLRVERARVPVGGEVLEGPPKTENSIRCIGLGDTTVCTFRRWEAQQKRERLKAGSAWQGSGYVFTNTDGKPQDPRWVSRLFVRAIVKANADARKAQAEAGIAAEDQTDVVPHLSIHGLRHTYATLALQAGVPVKVVSENLGHANIQITLNLYAHVLDEMRETAAQQTDDFIFAARA